MAVGIVFNFKYNNRDTQLLTHTTKLKDAAIAIQKEQKKTTTTTTKKEEVETTTQPVETTTVTTTVPKTTTKPQTTQPQVQENTSTTGNIIYSYLTHYGPDCAGCGGTTSSGYNVRNTIYYNDNTYGQVRIVAMSKNYPLYTVIKLKNYKYGTITAIVLDRGGAITGNKIDLLVSSESEASQCGIQNSVEVEILR